MKVPIIIVASAFFANKNSVHAITPTAQPTVVPTGKPSTAPSCVPSNEPTFSPVTLNPTSMPTPDPTPDPTHIRENSHYLMLYDAMIGLWVSSIILCCWSCFVCEKIHSDELASNTDHSGIPLVNTRDNNDVEAPNSNGATSEFGSEIRNNDDNIGDRSGNCTVCSAEKIKGAAGETPENQPLLEVSSFADLNDPIVTVISVDDVIMKEFHKMSVGG